MPRRQRSARLQTREARLKLTPRHAPYWQEVERGRALGYHRAVRRGSWRMRERIGNVYRKRYLGRADDLHEADGREILSFSDAVRVALQGARPTRTPAFGLTVDQAIEEYLEAKKVRSSSEDVLKERIAADRLILCTQGDRKLSQLTPDERHRLKYSLAGKRVEELHGAPTPLAGLPGANYR